MLKSIGPMEILVILVVALVMLALPICGIVWALTRRKSGIPPIESRACPNCGNHVPNFGSFCSICGKRFA